MRRYPCGFPRFRQFVRQSKKVKIASENECSGTANKKVHIDTCSTGEDLTPDANRVKETPVNSQPQHPDSNLHEESYTLFPTLSLKERFGHLLDDDTGKFSYEQHLLLLVQVKLDEYLAFIKIYRNYRRGDFFKNIKRNILSSSKLTIEMEQFRQILTIDPQMYVYSRELYFSYGYDILVGLPPRFDLAARKASFKLKMKQYLETRTADTRINPIKFVFEERQLKKGQVFVCEKAAENLGFVPFEQQLNSLDVLICKGNNFKEKLYRLIREKERQLLKSVYPQGQQRYGQKERWLVLDMIQLQYLSRNISNMFFINLVEALCKRTHISREVLNQIIDELHAHCPKYLCKIEHKKGLIIQIDKRMFSAARFVVADLPESTV